MDDFLGDFAIVEPGIVLLNDEVLRSLEICIAEIYVLPPRFVDGEARQRYIRLTLAYAGYDGLEIMTASKSMSMISSFMLSFSAIL